MSRYGTHGETAILPAKFVHKYPDFLTPAEAASINNPFLTAWGALIDRGGMTVGDFVLITAASSSVGVAAIQLARAVGAIPIAVTRTEKKRQALLNIAGEHVIVTASENIGRRVQEITEGKGARLIFDAVGGDTLQSLDQTAADQGIVFLYGAFDLGAPQVPMIPAITKELRLWGHMVYSVHNSVERLSRAFDFVYKTMFSTGLRPVIDRIFSLSEYAAAHRYLESNQQVGRVVITV
jgi:NADPH:quinone reductase-like Zn-dependent oxidoreductase